MRVVRQLLAGLVLGLAAATCVLAADASLLPKYGPGPKDTVQLEADRKFLAGQDAEFGGDRQKAAAVVVERGWAAFNRRNTDEAMRRFNQAWLLDPTNGRALWGMAAVSGMRQQVATSAALFAEAEPSMRGDVDFLVDHARTLAMVATEAKNPAQIEVALGRFKLIHAKAPQHTLNLQNWAIALSILGRYDEAWEKVELAEATPRSSAIDRRFVADLQAKWPRPGPGASQPVAAGAPAAAAGQRTPELWSHHKVLQMPATACAERATQVLDELGFQGVTRDGLSRYGNLAHNRAAMKCAEIPGGSFLYFAVAGADRATVELLRNRINTTW